MEEKQIAVEVEVTAEMISAGLFRFEELLPHVSSANLVEEVYKSMETARLASASTDR